MPLINNPVFANQGSPKPLLTHLYAVVIALAVLIHIKIQPVQSVSATLDSTKFKTVL